jgi:hypothetical protein
MFATVFGPQRSGTNYIESLLKENFDNIRVRNHDSNYVWKHCAYPQKFDNKLTSENNINIVVYKNPYKWIESLIKYNGDLENKFGGKKEEYADKYKTLQEGDVIIKDGRNKNTNVGGACRLYNDFYTNWYDYDKIDIMFVRYEDLLEDDKRAQFLEQIHSKYRLKRKGGGWVNPRKVGQSDPWTPEKSQVYLQMDKFNVINQVHIDLVNKYIDNKWFEKFKYPLIIKKV